jgi:signal transduction histidine kinase/ActR/RegA family two-component response regulator
MISPTASQRRAFLSILPARCTERRIALVAALTAAALFIAAAPFAKTPLPHVTAFIPIYESTLIINDTMTAILLFGQFTILRSRALLLLACGYSFAALMVVAHMLSFPGLFAETGLLGAGPQTTAWLYMFWHGGFPFFGILYALQPRAGEGDTMALRPRAAMLVGIGIVILLACVLVALATMGQASLPAIMDGSHYTPVMKGVVSTVWLLSLAALCLLWRRRPYSVMDLWLMVVFAVWLGDIALSVLLNAGRFDLGFYAGRIFGMAATSFILLVLLLETRALYARLAQSLDQERLTLQDANRVLRDREDELRHLNETLEQRVLERTRQLEAEIAERERAQEALRETQKLEAIGRMAGGIAHDFNNLLTVIQGNAEVLADGEHNAEDRSAIEGIDRAAERGARLVRQIMTFSRRQPLKLDIVDLQQREDDLAAMLGQVVRGDVRLIMTLADDIWSVKCDVTELEVALMNLCVNARDAMSKGGLLRLDGRNCRFASPETGIAGLTGDFVSLSISDTGTGIAPENIKRVFEPFFTTKDVGKGTGLGLSQVYGFAQQVGGTTAIDSKLGEGTTVTLYLPRATAVLPEQSVPRRNDISASGLVLLVEDDDDVAKVAKAMLKMIGYRVDHVRDGGTALALLLSGQIFDILFSDIVMPGGMNGLDLARSVRQRFPRLPILLTSGYARTTGDVYREGFNIIAKPYSVDSLAEALRRTVAEAEEAAKTARDTA